VTIGIRREDKNEWERRVPLIPSDLALLQKKHGISFVVQPSWIRVHEDEEYKAAGATVTENLSSAKVILAVKEIPIPLLMPRKVYVFFAHVAKGQPHNMPMLRHLMELGCSLLDYEKIVDEKNRRLVFFGRHAGYAGAIETLWALGQRLLAGHVETPFAAVRHAYEYSDLEEARKHLRELGARIAQEGLHPGLRPLIFGVAGYGNVSQGAQDILDCFPMTQIAPGELRAAAPPSPHDGPQLIKVVFKEEDMVQPTDPEEQFSLSDYYQNPDRYSSCFDRHLPYLDVLINGIYWDERYPRLVTREWVQRHYLPGLRPRLKVIGDISCDIAGSVEVTLKTTHPDAPCYVYNVLKHAIEDGCVGQGPAIMAVDNLPCELPREASQHFGEALRGMMPDLASADWEADFERLVLPPHLKRAVILHKGKLAPSYEYLERLVDVQ